MTIPHEARVLVVARDGGESMAVIHLSRHERLRRASTLSRRQTGVTWTHPILGECIEATDFAKQVLKGHPKWTALLWKTDGDNVENFHQWKHLVLQRDQLFMSAFVKSATLQAIGSFHADKEHAMELLDLARRVVHERAPHLLSRKYPALLADSSLQDMEQYVSLVKAFHRYETSSTAPKTAFFLQKWLEDLDRELLPSTSDEQPSNPVTEPSLTVLQVLPSIPSTTVVAHLPVVHAVQSGSAMYGLATSASDTDYHVVYLASSTEMLSLDASPHKSRQVTADAPYGSDKAGVVEYTLMELGAFLLSLGKGVPTAVELLFVADGHAGWVWEELVAMRHMFLTKHSVSKFLGFIRVHLSKARKHASVGDDRATAKALYHVFHKLFEARRILRGEDLHVRLRDAERDFVYKIRTEPLTGR